MTQSIPAQSVKDQRAVARWLFAVAAMIFAMVILGGLTRLTESGLSIVDWKPVIGAIPPLSTADWQAAFDEYKQFPEYKLHNMHMDLDQFKFIFLMEYSHRLLGRLIGLVFFLPFLYFLFTKKLKGLGLRLFLLFCLGGLQGFIGWYMVKSGLVDDPHVSQYRLVTHLSLAVITLTLAFWYGVGLVKLPAISDHKVLAQQWGPLFATALLVSVQMIAGGFVAGLDAGYSYNTWPLMNGQVVPDGLFNLTPFWHNLFESRLFVQFFHRHLALVVTGILLMLYLKYRHQTTDAQIRRAWSLIPLLVLIQVALGICTLVLVMPIALASAHQAVALLLWICLVFLLHQSYAAKTASA